MITRPYLLSTTSSRSSIGGLIMPSAAGVAATCAFRIWSAACALVGTGLLSKHQAYQLAADVLDGCIHEGDIEFAFGRQLAPGRFQPADDHLVRFSATAPEPANQLVPGRWREKDEQRVRHRRPDLAGALDV